MLSIAALSRDAKQHRLLAAIGANLTSEIARAAMLPVIAIVAARYLGADRYGIFATGQALTAFGATFAGFGLLHALLLLGSRREEPLSSLLTNSLAGALATAALAYAGLALWLWTFGYSETTRTAALIMGTSLFAMSVNSQLTAALQVQGRYTLIAVGGVVAAAVNVVYALAVVIAGLGLNAIALAPVVASCALAVLMGLALRGELRPAVQWGRITQLFRTGFLFGLGDFLSFIYFSIDLVILSLLTGEREVGLYNVPVRILVVAYVLPTVVFGRVLYPRYFEWSRTDRERLRQTYVLTSKGMLFVGLLAGLVLMLVAEPVVPAVFGGSFSESAVLLRILALAVPLRFMSASASAVLATTDKIATRVRVQVITAVLNLGLCFAVIPFWGVRGAAIATVITEGFLMGAQVVAVRSQVLDTNLIREGRAWLFLLPAVALLLGAIGHQPQWAIVVSGLVAIGSLVVIAGPMKYFGGITLPFRPRPSPEGEGAGVA